MTATGRSANLDAAAARAERTGRAVVRAYLNIHHVPPGPATVVLDAARRAGQAMDLAMRVRRQGEVQFGALEVYGRFIGMSAFELRTVCLPSLEAAGVVELLRDATGEVVAIDEQVGVAAPLLQQAAAVWERNGPDAEERCAITSSDLLAYAPMAESAHRAALEAEGFPASTHDAVFAALKAVNMLRRGWSERLGEEVLYSPYVWGTEAVDIAEFMANLPANDREMLSAMSRAALERPGTALDQLSSNDRLVAGARKVGLIDSTRVLTKGGTERAFAFSPALERSLASGATDVSHERKLFVAHILYGHRYEQWGRGRIENPIALVRALINNGYVGPTTSIRDDYPFLEAHGIVRVEEQSNGRAYLRLVKKDVAQDSLELLRLAVEEPASSGGASSLNSIWLPGTFTTPERDRRVAPELSPSDEADVINSAVDRLREETQRKLRGEEL